MAADTTAEAIPISRALDRIPVGRFHRRLLAICGSAWAFDGMEVIIISFTLPVLIGAWGLSGLSAGLLGSASLMGMIVGNWGWGWYADRYGRKPAFQWTVLTYSLFAGLTAFAVGFPSGFALRFLTPSTPPTSRSTCPRTGGAATSSTSTRSGPSGTSSR